MNYDITRNHDILNVSMKLRKVGKKSCTRWDHLFHIVTSLLVGTQTTHAKHSATTALLWLHRELAFVKELLIAIAEAQGVSDMSAK